MLVIVCLQLPEDIGTIVASASEAGKFDFGSTAFDLRQPTMWTVLIATFFTNITTYGTDQTIVQRYLTTATEREARKGVYVNAALTIPATILFFLVGTALWAFYRHYPTELSMAVRDSDAILPWYISTQLPSGVLGLIIAGLFAAAMSTLSSSMNSAATAFVTDIYRKLRPATHDGRALLRTARLSTLVLGLVGVGFALMMASWEIKSLWDEFSKILGILLGGLGGLFLLGLTTRRANTFGALCGIAAQHRRTDTRIPQRVCQFTALFHHRIPFVLHCRLYRKSLRAPQQPRHRFTDHLRKTKNPCVTRFQQLLHEPVIVRKFLPDIFVL